MKQEIYNTYKISVDGDNGKFVITSIQNKAGEKLDSQNDSKEFKSQDEAITAAKAQIDKKSKDKKEDESETEATAETDVVAESEFDKLFNNILMQYKLQDDWKKVIKEDSFGIDAVTTNAEQEELPDDTGYDADPEFAMQQNYDIENKQEITVDNVIQNIKNAQNKQEEKNIIKDVKDNHSEILNDLTKKLQDIINNPPDDMNNEKSQQIQQLIEFSKK